MKKSILILTGTALILIHNDFYAQDQGPTTSRDAKRKIVAGVKVGVNRSNVYNASGEAFSADRKQGIAAGVFVALPLGGLFGFQPELVFQQKGFEGTGMLLGDRYVISRTTTHIDIPLQLQIKPFKWFTFLVGPNYSYMMNQSDKFSLEGSSASSVRGFDNSDYRRSTFGTIVGIDFNFGHLVLSGRSGWT